MKKNVTKFENSLAKNYTALESALKKNYTAFETALKKNATNSTHVNATAVLSRPLGGPRLLRDGFIGGERGNDTHPHNETMPEEHQ